MLKGNFRELLKAGGELRRTPSLRSSVCPIISVLRASPVRGLNRGGYDHCLMYAGLCALETLHKITCWIGPGICIMPEVNFAFWGFSEVSQEFIGDSSTLASVAESAGVAELRSPAPLRKEE
jgi:hypothetical protein